MEVAEPGLQNGAIRDRWEAQLRKGAVEVAALAALWNGPLYGLEIIRSLESNSRLALSEGTIYTILTRLKAEGLLDAEWVEAKAGHPRKYYSLTATGRDRAWRMALAWTHFSRGMGRLIEPMLEQERVSDRGFDQPAAHW